MPDPKLIIAMEEIKAVLAKHDIAGVVFLSSRTHLEYLHHFHATWSVARLDGNYLRFRSKREDFYSQEEQDANTNATVGMIRAMGAVCASTATHLGQLEVKLIEHMDISGDAIKDHEPHVPASPTADPLPSSPGLASSPADDPLAPPPGP